MKTLSNIDSLLDEPIAEAEARAASEFDRIAGQVGGRIVLFGAGQLGVKTLQTLRAGNVEPLAFSDNNPLKWDQFIEGIRVLSPSEAAEKFGDSAVFVVTIWSPGNSCIRTQTQLTALGCKIVVPWALLAWKFSENLLPHYLFHLPQAILRERHEIRRAFRLMADEESRRVFRAHLCLRLKCDFSELSDTSPSAQYFPEDIVSLIPHEVFVDGGAYEGDTIEVFLKQSRSNFREIIAFEPDPNSYETLHSLVSSLRDPINGKIRYRNCALGRTREKLCFDAMGAPGSCANAAGATLVDCVALDEELPSCAPTFIKMDVEGSELDALAGSERIIETLSPLLAVCVYHRPFDLWRVPLYIAGLNPGYVLYLRQHGEDGLDAVVYAIPPWRSTRT